MAGGPLTTDWGGPRNKYMKKLLVGLIAAWTLAQAGAAELNWLTDLDKAQSQAKTEKKLVLMDFTGSDWCSWCIKLHKEVFDQPEFIEYAKKYLVPVEIDFPRTKKQAPELKKANQALAQKYDIKGYPTIVVLDASGKKLGELGYEVGGPKAFIASLEKLK